MKYLLTLLFFMSMTCCLAQNNWKPGFIVTDSDTMYGYIDDRGSKSLSLQCHFRSSPEAERQLFSPSQLEAFGFMDKKLFVSLIPEDAQEPFFMEYILKGRVSIFHMMEDKSRFFAEKDGRLYELKNTIADIDHPNIEHTTALKYQAERKEYIGILMYLLADGGLEHKINQSLLRVNSLVDLAYTYHMNVCPDEHCIDYTRMSRKTRLEVGLLGGMYANSFSYGKSLSSNKGTGNFMGLRLELRNALDFLERVSLVLDFSLSKYSDYTIKPLDRTINRVTLDGTTYFLSRTNIYDDNQVATLDVNINSLSLHVPLVFSWNFFSGGTFRPYAGAGLVNMFILSQNEGFVHKGFHNAFSQSVPAYHIGYIGRAGSKIMVRNNIAFFLEASFHQTMNPNQNLALRFNNKTFSFTTGLSF